MNRMSYPKRAVILTELADKLYCAGSWCGETHLQKAAYFLQELLGVPLGYDFILYKHGPFSFDLHRELTELRADSLLQLEARPPYGPRLVSTAVAPDIKKRFPKTLGKYKKQIDFVANHLGEKGVAELERLATAFYVTQEGEGKSQADRARRIHELKRHVTLDLALTAVDEIDRIHEASSKLALRHE